MSGISEKKDAVDFLTVRRLYEKGKQQRHAIARIDTPEEVLYYKHGGILPYVLRQLLS